MLMVMLTVDEDDDGDDFNVDDNCKKYSFCVISWSLHDKHQRNSRQFGALQFASVWDIHPLTHFLLRKSPILHVKNGMYLCSGLQSCAILISKYDLVAKDGTSGSKTSGWLVPWGTPNEGQ